jgi:AcrR family transcriptional regulator
MSRALLSILATDPHLEHNRNMQPESRARTARERVREEIRGEILAEARRQLAEVGAVGLSLRAVARAVGMVSSAVYRYFPSRDELLTTLIIEAYDAIGEAAEAAEAAAAARDRDDLEGRWRAAALGTRAWAVAHPHQYALIYGTPVPGYHAPSDRTVPPATRVTAVMTAILRDGVTSGRLAGDGLGGDGLGGDSLLADDPPLPSGYRADLARLRAMASPEVPEELLARGLLAWTLIFGAITFEVFGRLDGFIDDRDGYFADQLERAARLMGLADSGRESRWRPDQDITLAP